MRLWIGLVGTLAEEMVARNSTNECHFERRAEENAIGECRLSTIDHYNIFCAEFTS